MVGGVRRRGLLLTQHGKGEEQMCKDELEAVCGELLEEFYHEKEQRNRVVNSKILSDIVVKLSFLTKPSEINHLI